MPEQTERPEPGKLLRAFLYLLVILGVNILIARQLFSLEYSDRLSSIEGTFIAIAKQIAAHPRDLLWWPAWDCGLPFQNTYLPLTHLMVAAFSTVTGHSAPLSYHQVSAAFFCLGPVSLFLMAVVVTRDAGSSFFAALAYSVFSPVALLLPAIARDLGSHARLRRLQILIDYGEGPSTAAMALFPLAILFLYLAFQKRGLAMKVLAGVFMGLSVLANAFGGTILLMAVTALLFSMERKRFQRNAIIAAVTALLAWCWISPLFPPSVLAAIRMNSPTVEGDYRFNAASLAGCVVLAAAFALVTVLLARRGASLAIRFFLLFALLVSGVVTLGYFAGINIVPQPHRYQNAMDMALCLLVVFAGRSWLRRVPARFTLVAATVCMTAIAVMAIQQIRYGHRLIRTIDVTRTAPWRIAKWMDTHMNGQRVMVGGAYSFPFNVFTDTPQLHGGHETMLPDYLIRVAVYQIYSGDNAAGSEGEIAALWLKALGAHAISVPGPTSAEAYKPFRNPAKFEGILPVLWREGGDTIYGVPSRSDSLAHVIPRSAAVHTVPVNGLDIGQIRTYVAAIEDQAIPDASWQWTSRHSGVIRATLRPDEVISLQTTFSKGWKATVAGQPQEVRSDGLGFLIVEPDCIGSCVVTMTYDGGIELLVTSGLSASVMACLLLVFVYRRWKTIVHSPR